MTDLIERVDAVFEGERTHEQPEPSGDHARASRHAESTERAVPILLAVSLAASAVLLFAVASGHLTGAVAGFGVVIALAQVVAAVLVITKPSRALYAGVAALSVAAGILWVAGYRPHGLATATVAIGMALCAIALLTAALLAARPSVGRTWSSSTVVIGSMLPLAIAVILVVALFATPLRSVTSAATPPVSAGGASAALAQATTVHVPGENSKTFKSLVAGNTTEQSELKKFVPLDPATQALLSQQLAQAQQAAMRFPTFGSAKAAGMILAGGMAPGVGAHMQNFSDSFSDVNPDGSINPSQPASWIYAGTAPNDPVVGLMYISFDKTAPAGFAGPNDHWHQHSNVCVKFANGMIAVPFAVDQDVTPQECADAHGQFMKKTVWMVHAWVVPGWESPQGVFSHDNLHVYCPGNTDLTNAIGMCDRQS